MIIYIDNPEKNILQAPVIPTPTAEIQPQCQYEIPSVEGFNFTWEGADTSTISEINSFERNIEITAKDIVNTLAQKNPTLANILTTEEGISSIPYWITYRFMTEFMYSDPTKERSVSNIQQDSDLLKTYSQFIVVLAKTTQMSYFSSIDSDCTTPIRQILLELLYSGNLEQEEKDAIIFMLTDGYNEYSKDKDLNNECTFDYDGFISFINEQKFGYKYKPTNKGAQSNTDKNNPCNSAQQKKDGKQLKLENKEIKRQERLGDIQRPLTIRNYKNR